MIQVNFENNDVILEGHTVTSGESGSVETAEQEMDQETLEETSQLQPGNRECVQDTLIGNQNQPESPPKYTSNLRKRSSIHKEFRPVLMEHPNTKEKIEGRECKHCLTVMRGKNPTNLKQHIRTHHPAVLQKTHDDLFINQQS